MKVELLPESEANTDLRAKLAGSRRYGADRAWSDFSHTYIIIRSFSSSYGGIKHTQKDIKVFFHKVHKYLVSTRKPTLCQETN